MKRNIVIIILIIHLIIGCNKPDDTGLITIYNRTNENIIIIYSKDYPDTINMTTYAVCSIDNPDTMCLAYDKGWKGRFNQNPLGVLVFIIGNRDSLIKYSGVEEQHQNSIIRKKYFLTIDSMERNNWKIIYP